MQHELYCTFSLRKTDRLRRRKKRGKDVYIRSVVVEGRSRRSVKFPTRTRSVSPPPSFSFQVRERRVRAGAWIEKNWTDAVASESSLLPPSYPPPRARDGAVVTVFGSDDCFPVLSPQRRRRRREMSPTVRGSDVCQRKVAAFYARSEKKRKRARLKRGTLNQRRRQWKFRHVRRPLPFT